jgi:hypothetical protein
MNKIWLQRYALLGHIRVKHIQLSQDDPEVSSSWSQLAIGGLMGEEYANALPL